MERKPAGIAASSAAQTCSVQAAMTVIQDQFARIVMRAIDPIAFARAVTYSMWMARRVVDGKCVGGITRRGGTDSTRCPIDAWSREAAAPPA